MAKNENLHKAKTQKNDEFYTQYEDIQKELNHYEQHFKGKTVLCNCDDPFESNFCKFFLRNFNYLGLKRLICTSYNGSPVAGTQMSLFDLIDGTTEEGHGYVLDVTKVSMANGRGVSDDDIDKLLRSKKCVKELRGNGDFRNQECLDLLDEADIVVTNPPFSLFREYVAVLMEHKKKFLILGNKNAATNDKDIFPLFYQNECWFGFNSPAEFNTPDGITKKVNGLTRWFTNLDITKRHEKLILWKQFDANDYKRFDNYDAIIVDKTSDIPCDYDGIMGVPITFLDKYNPEQFELLGRTGDLEWAENVCDFFNPPEESLQKIYKKQNKTWRVQNAYYVLDGKAYNVYSRIFIRRKQ